MTVRRIAAVLGLAFLAPAVVAAQGLGDAAARERAKRAAKKAVETKVLTNADLEASRPPGAAPAEASSAPAPAEGAGEAAAPPPMEDRLADQRSSLDALQAAQARVSQIESRIQALQAKLNPMSGSFIYGASGSNSANEEAEVRAQLAQAQAELDAARQAVVAAAQAVQGSKRGQPPSPTEGPY